MIINAFIKGQALTLPRAKLVAGSNDYLELRAVFQTGDWSGLNVWAHFTQDSKNIFDLELHDGKINKDQHLNLAEGVWKVYFTGMALDGALKITTEVQTLTVEATGVTCGGFPDVPPSHAEQITKDAAEAKRLAQEALDTVTDNLPLTERAEAAAKAAEGSAKNSAQSAEASAESAASSAMSARRADESAQAASGSAAAATAAQVEAAGSASGAAESAQQAKGYEDEARRQAIASAGSASAAQKSAAAAKGSESTVKADADRASTEASKAAKSEQNAQAAAEAAKSSEDSALASQQAAETAASDASNSATTAGQKATAAAGSAEQAQKAANNAEKSALSGGKDADRAEVAYGNATQQADRAKSEADRAEKTVTKETFSSDTAPDVADKAVPDMSLSYLPGMEIYVQLDKGNAAEVMNIVPDEGPTLPVYGNGTGAKTGLISAGYILHLKNAGDHWQILNGGTGSIDDSTVDKDSTHSSLKNNTDYASALVRTVQGEVIAVDDVSPLEHSVGCKVSSKNKLSVKKIVTAYTLVNNGNGSITVTGEPGGGGTNLQSFSYFADLVPGKTYTLSAESTSKNKFIYLGGSRKVWRFGESLVISEEGLTSYVSFYADSEGKTATISDIQIEEGSVATPFAPYIPDLSKVTVSRRRADGTDTQTYNPNAEGIVSGMKSLSPNMTVLTDTPGALLDVSYNQDSMVVIKKLSDRITELENNAVK